MGTTATGVPAYELTSDYAQPALPSIAAMANEAGLHRVHILAWRDLDDPEAGGSELHAHRIASLWAEAGIDVTVRTSEIAGRPAYEERSGYHVVRKAGRYMVFPRSAISGRLRRGGSRDALVEIWNGMPFFSPLWASCTRIIFLHHVHAEMWRMVLPARLARIGEMVEFRLAPPVYRRSRIVTLSESSREEIIHMLGIPARNISVVPPGVDRKFSPGGQRSPHPLVVAVGRLAPVKRFGVLIEALAQLRARHAGIEAVIVGEGHERPALEDRVRSLGASDWIRLPGRVSDDTLVHLYRRAWVLASTSAREGWGMTVTEAGACGTPAVVTRIAGHIDAVDHGQSGLLAEPADMAGHLDAVLSDPGLMEHLGAGALERARRFSWEATAHGTMAVLALEASGRVARGHRAVLDRLRLRG